MSDFYWGVIVGYLFAAVWFAAWWKPSEDRVRNLETAGALIAAEIDRLTANVHRPAPTKGEG